MWRLKIKGIFTLHSKESELKGKPCQTFVFLAPKIFAFFEEFFHLQIVI